MPLYTKQKVHCMICGKEGETVLAKSPSKTCSQECFEEYSWRETLSIMGKEYYPRKKDEAASTETS